MPRATSANRLIHARLDARARDASRYQDLQLEFQRSNGKKPDGRVVSKFGGRWDRTKKDFAGDAERSRVIGVHGFQLDAVRSFDAWMDRHLSGANDTQDARSRELVLADAEVTAADINTSEFWLVGARRSGKTFIAVALACGYAIAVPKSIVWIVVPTEAFFDEPIDVIDEVMPHDWFSWHGDPSFRFDLVNGSRIHLRSAVKPGNLKHGRADLVMFNEGQLIQKASYTTANASTIDRNGATIVAANPPIAGDQPWVLDACLKMTKRQRPGAELFLAESTDNPHISQTAILAKRATMDDHTWMTQMKGKLLEMPDVVFYQWSRAINERPPPNIGKITNAFLKAHEGDRADWRHLVVIDVQMYPWIAAGVFDVYRDPDDPDEKAGILWMVDEVALAQADEVDVCDELKRRGIDPDRTLVVMDASCRWQQARRDEKTQRPQFTGQGSMAIMRANGFKHVVPPSRSLRGNPLVVERIRATNAAIKAADGIARLYVDPKKCTNAVESIRKWRLGKNNKVSRDSKAAHFGDVVSYCVYRFKARLEEADDSLQSEVIARPRGDGFDDIERERK